MKNIVPFGTAKVCDACQGSGRSTVVPEGFTSCMSVSCLMCHGIGEIRVPKAVEGPKDHPLNYQFPKFDWAGFKGECRVIREYIIMTEALASSCTNDVNDLDIVDLSSEVLACLNKAQMKMAEILDRAERMRGR